MIINNSYLISAVTINDNVVVNTGVAGVVEFSVTDEGVGVPDVQVKCSFTPTDPMIRFALSPAERVNQMPNTTDPKDDYDRVIMKTDSDGKFQVSIAQWVSTHQVVVVGVIKDTSKAACSVVNFITAS